MNLYENVAVEQCFKKTGTNPITARWVDINKGDATSPNYRSRLVPREVNTYKRDDYFAATPPSEAFKMIISMAAIANRGSITMVNDIRRAFLHATMTRDVYLHLPEEDRNPGEEGLCVKFRCSMRGMSDAAQN